MKLYHIVAHAENRVIGSDRGIPWNCDRDLHRFRELTSGHAVVMGRKTAESIGRPLPNRFNVVLSKDETFQFPDLGVVEEAGEVRPPDHTNFFVLLENELSSALDKVRDRGYEECYIIGGEEIYRQTMDLVDSVRSTIIHQHPDGDAFYPELDEDEWSMTFTEPGSDFSFVDYARVVE